MNLSRRSLLGAATITATSLAVPSVGLLNPALASDESEDPYDGPNYVPTGLPARRRYWPEGPALNQHGLNACEAFALVAAWAAATGADMTRHQGNQLARHIFKSNGDPAGIAPFQAMQIAQDLGMAKTWAYIQSVDDVVDAVCHHGPVSLGINPNYVFSHTDGREIRGPGRDGVTSHAVVATAYLPFDKRSGRGASLRLRNSWGKTWGLNGSAWMTVSDLKKNIGPRPYYGYYEDAVVTSWV